MKISSVVDHPDLIDVLRELIDDLVDSCLMDGILIMHRAIKLGYFHIIAPEPQIDDSLSDNVLSSTSGTGSSRDLSNKATGCCRCGKCNCKVAATRYAAHLSNCMGLGRNSSRRANKRIAEQQRLEDDDSEIEDELLSENSMNDIFRSKSSTNSTEQFECRYTNDTTNRHQSPLKLTISLVPNSNKSDSNPKHTSKQSDLSVTEQYRNQVCTNVNASTNVHNNHNGNANSKSTMMNSNDHLMEPSVVVTRHD